jgi:AraC-like DNA-binding protein
MNEADVLKRFEAKKLRFRAGWRHRFPRGPGRRHSHPTIELVYHLKGEGTSELEGGRSIRFRENSVEIYPPGTVHIQDMEVKGEDLCVLVTAPGPISGWLDVPLHIPSAYRPDILEDFFWLANMPPQPDPLLRLSCDHCATSLVLRLLAMLRTSSTAGDSPEAYAARATEFIRYNFRNIRQVREVAKHVGISYDHLRHVYKRTYGMGLKEFLVQTRISQAKSLIIHSQMPFKAIAWMCGFRTDRYFSTCFRKAVGCSPGEFRKSRGKSG